MRLYQRLLLAAVLVTASACRHDSPRATDPEQVLRQGQGIVAGTLEVEVDTTAQTLTLRNNTEYVIGFMPVEKQVMTIAIFPPCGSICPILAQGQSKTIRYTDIIGYTPGALEARVLWWTYVRQDDGKSHAQGGVRTVIVHLD